MTRLRTAVIRLARYRGHIGIGDVENLGLSEGAARNLLDELVQDRQLEPHLGGGFRPLRRYQRKRLRLTIEREAPDGTWEPLFMAEGTINFLDQALHRWLAWYRRESGP